MSCNNYFYGIGGQPDDGIRVGGGGGGGGGGGCEGGGGFFVEQKR